MPPAFATATRRLIELGHRRIVFLHKQLQRVPDSNATEQAFLSELAVHGIMTSPYNLPRWDDTKPGFYDCLPNLFSVTPPTALIIIQWANHVAHRRSDTRQSLAPAKFIHGGTIGPAANYAKKQ